MLLKYYGFIYYGVRLVYDGIDYYDSYYGFIYYNWFWLFNGWIGYITDYYYMKD